MPGSRLSPQDRQAIATGLAEGLDYAAIARRIARPTSTVTREIARNGGPARYRAETAQRATLRRARRRPGPTRLPEGSAQIPEGRDPAAVAEFADRFADLLTHLGLPRMAARVLSCLYVTDTGRLTSAELVQRLAVSPASISKAVGYLEAQELIRRVREEPGRRESYLIDDDVWYRSMLAAAQRNALLAEFTRDGAALLGPATPAGERLDTAAAFLAEIGTVLARAVIAGAAQKGARRTARPATSQGARLRSAPRPPPSGCSRAQLSGNSK
ncbi:MarR family transcriptional regulator [Kitasatospora sp. MMS16-BH015]|uniref:GbsR/MarR family transcriptional regulator n=1 Tax=Kitasatospora sp. MMS16-BH015 TaxID=2018025 RepID=UPI000CA3AB30|nr:helix-turn-helix domain-containing protein [Kitasatospora sp. MMS16-BH015]AUG81338.1 MarR family transcriptional regulator [Kitasatospora sp. MMS16-BH015]